MDDRTQTPAAGEPDGAADAVTPAPDEAAQHAQDLLAEHVPLALLVDLVNAQPSASEELLVTEGLPEQQWWDGEGPEPTPEG